MTDYLSTPIYLPACKGRKVEINFEGGDVTSDGGILLLQQIDQKLGLTEKIARQFCDKRDQRKVKHDLLSKIKFFSDCKALLFRFFISHVLYSILYMRAIYAAVNVNSYPSGYVLYPVSSLALFLLVFCLPVFFL